MEYFYSIFHFFVVYTACGFCLKNFELSTRESFCHSGWLSLCFIYLIYKILFLLKIPGYSLYFDLILDSLLVTYIFKRSKSLEESFMRSITFLCAQSISTKLVVILIAIPLLYGLALALLLSPTTIDVNAYHESRILLMQQESTYFLEKFNDICEVAYGLGYDLILHNNLRFGEDRGLGIYGYISFLCIIGLLFNFFNDKETKEYWYFLPAILFLGLIEPIYQSFSAKNDLPGALACLASFHLFMRWRKSPSKEQIFLSVLAITWAVACKKVYLAFALPMLILWLWEWKKYNLIMSLSRKQLLLSTIVLLFVSPAFIYLYNVILWGSWTGPADFVEQNKNQSIVLGTIGNFFRYSLEIFHFPEFIDVWLNNNFNITTVEWLNQLWTTLFNPFFGKHGEGNWTFLVQWGQFEDSWFGPFGFILFAGFLLTTFKKKNTHQKYSYFLSIFILLIICNQLAWRPFNDRYFSLFFILLAISHTKISLINSIPLLRIITLSFSVFLLNWALFFNQSLRTINFASLNFKAVYKDISQNSVLIRTNFGRTKLGYPQIPPEIINNIKRNSRISIWTEGYTPLASITRQLNDSKFEPLRYKVTDEHKVNQFLEIPMDLVLKTDYLLYLGKGNLLSANENIFEPIWKYKNTKNEIWSLLKVNKTKS
jgi:hypothetical protein